MWAEDEYKDYLAEIEWEYLHLVELSCELGLIDWLIRSNKPQVRDILNDIGQMQIQVSDFILFFSFS